MNYHNFGLLLIFLGIFLIFLGFFVIFYSHLSVAQVKNIETGGAIIVGPIIIPFGSFSKKEYFPYLLFFSFLSIILAVLYLLIFLKILK